MEEWKQYKLGEISSIITKGIAPCYSESASKNTIVVLNQKCNRNFSISFNEARIHNDSKRHINAERLLKDGDVLINSTGHGTAGRVAQLFGVNGRKVTFDGHMILLRPTKLVDPLYYGYALKNKQSEILLLEEGSTGQTEINRNRLKEEIILSVPKGIETQREIAEILRNLDIKIELNNRINHNLKPSQYYLTIQSAA